MERYLIDTNVISYLLSGKLSNEGLQLIKKVIDDKPNISIISKIELLSWKTTDNVESIVGSFVSDSNVININDNIVNLCISLRRKRNIKTPDAIIAATAIDGNYTIVTNNEKDFTNIRKLKIINPLKL